MGIINAVQIVVFIMPTKCRKEHSYVEPRYINTRDIGLQMFQERSMHVRKQIKIPPCSAIVAFVVKYALALYRRWFNSH
jgi:hypothetical protein